MAYQPLSSFRLFASALYGLDIKNRAYIRHHLLDIGSFFIIVECRKSHTPDDRQRFHQHLMNADCLGYSFHHLQDLYIHHRLHELKELPHRKVHHNHMPLLWDIHPQNGIHSHRQPLFQDDGVHLRVLLVLYA